MQFKKLIMSLVVYTLQLKKQELQIIHSHFLPLIMVHGSKRIYWRICWLLINISILAHFVHIISVMQQLNRLYHNHNQSIQVYFIWVSSPHGKFSNPTYSILHTQSVCRFPFSIFQFYRNQTNF